MKLVEWLFSNHNYDEAIAIDLDGNECMFWVEDDEKLNATVLKVEDRDAYGCTANVFIDYRS